MEGGFYIGEGNEKGVDERGGGLPLLGLHA